MPRALANKIVLKREEMSCMISFNNNNTSDSQDVPTFDIVGTGECDRMAADARSDKSDHDEGGGDNWGSHCGYWLLQIDCG